PQIDPALAQNQNPTPDLDHIQSTQHTEPTIQLPLNSPGLTAKHSDFNYPQRRFLFPNP
ncbi:3484_t:CDS:1, partial [Dentiscutata heterogama]